MVAGQTNGQVDDLAGRPAAAHPQLPVARLAARGYALPERVTRHESVQAATNVADLAGCPSRDPMSSAVAVLLNHNPRIPVHTLPVSWRLPATAAPVVSESFYPFTGFASATSCSGRQLGWNTRAFGTSALDLALETTAESGWAL